MSRSVLVGAIVLGLTFGIIRPATAQNEPTPLPQSFFVDELVGGTLGAVLTGPLLTWLLVNSSCSGSTNPGLCRGVANVQIRPLVFAIAIPPGAILGIWAMGTIDGVEGNLTYAAIGSFLGGLGGLLEAFFVYYGIDWLFSPEAQDYIASSDAPEYLKFFLPRLIEFLRPVEGTIKEIAMAALPTITAALFGTIGFNINARLRP
jgi:hypothetical protein